MIFDNLNEALTSYYLNVKCALVNVQLMFHLDNRRK